MFEFLFKGAIYIDKEELVPQATFGIESILVEWVSG